MASVPTKQMNALYMKALNNQGNAIKSGHYELFIGDGLGTGNDWIKVVASGNLIPMIELKHYGTTIFYWNLKTGEVHTGGAWSASDRDAINGLLTLMGFPRCAYIRRGEMHFDHRWFNEYLEDKTL